MQVEKYISNPVQIEAIQLSVDNMTDVEFWCGGSIKGTKLPPEERELEIHTLEGDMRAEIGDYIIRGTEGEFYPCKESVLRGNIN